MSRKIGRRSGNLRRTREMSGRRVKRAPSRDEGKFDGIKTAFGIPLARRLDLCGMSADVARLGYEDEGLRFTLAIHSPYDFNAEVKLSRADAEWLRSRLDAELADPKNSNMPKGSR